jgi:dihydroorotate dehydrogenase electron transfer subunit
MIEAAIQLLEVQSAGAGLVSGRIPCPPRLAIKPGQYLLASAPGLSECLPTALFPAQLTGDTILLAPPLPPAWLPGIALALRGPFGKGFHLPPAARRMALAALDVHPFRLLPLIAPALAQGMEIALFTQLIPPGLPPQVEVLPIQNLPEAAAWADYLAIDLLQLGLPGLPARLGLKPGQSLTCRAEALVVTAMPCGGLADCGVCAVKTAAGWHLACKDGPVFDFASLELE